MTLMAVRRAIPFAKSNAHDGTVVTPKPRRPRGGKRTRVKVKRSGIHSRGARGMVEWLKRDFPEAHKALLAKRPDLVGSATAADAVSAQLGATEPGTASTAQRIADFVQPLLQVYQQRQILKLQLKRAEQGLPPADVESLAPTVQIEAGKETRKAGIMIAVVAAMTIAVGLAIASARRGS